MQMYDSFLLMYFIASNHKNGVKTAVRVRDEEEDERLSCQSESTQRILGATRLNWWKEGWSNAGITQLKVIGTRASEQTEYRSITTLKLTDMQLVITLVSKYFPSLPSDCLAKRCHVVGRPASKTAAKSFGTRRSAENDLPYHFALINLKSRYLSCQTRELPSPVHICFYHLLFSIFFNSKRSTWHSLFLPLKISRPIQI